MKYYTCKEIRKFDREAIRKYKIPGIVLMENAALRFFDELKNSIRTLKAKKAVVVCGSGNNGGDGFAIARHLFNAEAVPVILYTGNVQKLSKTSDAGINAAAAMNMGIPVYEHIVSDKRKFSSRLKHADIVIDALFGTGLARDVEGNYAALVDTMSECKKVISVDIPSGLNGDTGLPMGTAVKADMTVTFAGAKKGFRKKSAREYTGILKVVPISIPAFLFK